MNSAIVFELSATLNVGVKLAPRKITKRLSEALSVKGLPFIITVGAWVSLLLTVSSAEVSSLFRYVAIALIFVLSSTVGSVIDTRPVEVSTVTPSGRLPTTPHDDPSFLTVSVVSLCCLVGL